ncbi:hemerythrin domain-containing protein [Thermoflexus sp.]|uniref:hemerythrin domain-containing protein n=1 Tax=Thermoflexus sp. TaxID=1969742 RepID=UPI0035E3F58F
MRPDEPLRAIAAALRAEHRLLRRMMARMADWLAEGVSPEGLKERGHMLFEALEDHARYEEEKLFSQLRERSPHARHLVGMMELVHEEVRETMRMALERADPREDLWTLLQLSEEHFEVEEQAVFPLAEEGSEAAIRERPVG